MNTNDDNYIVISDDDNDVPSDSPSMEGMLPLDSENYGQISADEEYKETIGRTRWLLFSDDIKETHENFGDASEAIMANIADKHLFYRIFTFFRMVGYDLTSTRNNEYINAAMIRLDSRRWARPTIDDFLTVCTMLKMYIYDRSWDNSVTNYGLHPWLTIMENNGVLSRVFDVIIEILENTEDWLSITYANGEFVPITSFPSRKNYITGEDEEVDSPYIINVHNANHIVRMIRLKFNALLTQYNDYATNRQVPSKTEMDTLTDELAQVKYAIHVFTNRVDEFDAAYTQFVQMTLQYDRNPAMNVKQRTFYPESYFEMIRRR